MVHSSNPDIVRLKEPGWKSPLSAQEYSYLPDNEPHSKPLSKAAAPLNDPLTVAPEILMLETPPAATCNKDTGAVVVTGIEDVTGGVVMGGVEVSAWLQETENSEIPNIIAMESQRYFFITVKPPWLTGGVVTV